MNFEQLEEELRGKIDAMFAEYRAKVEAMNQNWELIGLAFDKSIDKAPYYISYKGIVFHQNYIDEDQWEYGNCYRTLEQAEAFSEAFQVLQVMRRQPGIVDPSKVDGVWISVDITSGNLIHFNEMNNKRVISIFMFPAFSTHGHAEAAISAVGRDKIIRCAKTLAMVQS